MSTTERTEGSTWSRYPLPVEIGRRRIAILAEGCFSPLGAKTAVCLVRYVPDEIVAVIDSSQAPATVQQLLGFGGPIPVVASIGEALAHDPDILLLGTAPTGGQPPQGSREAVIEGIESGLHIVSGMHLFFGGDPELAGLARKKGVVIWDVRKPPPILRVSSGAPCPFCPVVLTVGSDCNTGKMTAAIEVARGISVAGLEVGFAASGQTGMMITGRGIPVDAVVADFISGATEQLVLETAPGRDVVILEGQGSVLHPGYAGVTIGMMSGSLPNGMILCHQPTRTVIRNYEVPIPPLARLVELYRSAIAGIADIPVIGIALNTFDMSDRDARKAIEKASRETGLAVTDPVRFGPDDLIPALRSALSL
jgi:uncharacterized NAD-dependent epimerase/dehydratase family protein